MQHHLFTAADLGFAHVAPPSERPEITKRLVMVNALDFSAEEARAWLQPKIESIAANGLTPVLSAERLSGAFQAGGYDSAEIAARLKEVFPEAKILMVIREQRSMILSAYVQYVRAGGARSFLRYMRGPSRAKGFLPGFGVEHFLYDRLVHRYIELFGPDKVLVLPYEQFLKNPLAFVRQVVQFGGREPSEADLGKLPVQQRVNAGFSPLTIALKRRFNRLFVDSTLNPGVWLPLPARAEKMFTRFVQVLDRLIPKSLSAGADLKQKQYLLKKYGEKFRQSNNRLRQLTGLDLKEYGYEI